MRSTSCTGASTAPAPCAPAVDDQRHRAAPHSHPDLVLDQRLLAEVLAVDPR
jgi:hypothetical protein